ncbi:MAG: hypothetical protein ABL985_08150 [Casimicrobium sp.]
MPTHLFDDIRLVICDLHLEPASALSNNGQQYHLIAAQLVAMKLKRFTPYALILWTSFPAECEALKQLLSTRLPIENRPMVIVALDKSKYGFGSGSTATKGCNLWEDLRTKIRESRGLNALLQWEGEVHAAGGNTVCKLVEICRSRAGNEQLSLDDQVDWLLSLIAVEATSAKTAAAQPRHAVFEGLHALLLDELQHVATTAETQSTWEMALTKRTQKKAKFDLKHNEAAKLNDALLISQTPATGATRGAVLTCWLDDAGFETAFGLKPQQVLEKMGVADTGILPKITWRFLQLEGDCDAVQNKPGVVPFALAAELANDDKLREQPPQSVVLTPLFFTDKGDKKLLVSFRFFVTLAKESAEKRTAHYRLREPLVNWLATQWTGYLNRPGYVSFQADS